MYTHRLAFETGGSTEHHFRNLYHSSPPSPRLRLPLTTASFSYFLPILSMPSPNHTSFDHSFTSADPFSLLSIPSSLWLSREADFIQWLFSSIDHCYVDRTDRSLAHTLDNRSLGEALFVFGEAVLVFLFVQVCTWKNAESSHVTATTTATSTTARNGGILGSLVCFFCGKARADGGRVEERAIAGGGRGSRKLGKGKGETSKAGNEWGKFYVLSTFTKKKSQQNIHVNWSSVFVVCYTVVWYAGCFLSLFLSGHLLLFFFCFLCHSVFCCSSPLLVSFFVFVALFSAFSILFSLSLSLFVLLIAFFLIFIFIFVIACRYACTYSVCVGLRYILQDYRCNTRPNG